MSFVQWHAEPVNKWYTEVEVTQGEKTHILKHFQAIITTNHPGTNTDAL